MSTLKSWLTRLTVDQWRALEAEYTPKEPPSEEDRWKVLGLYFLFAIILVLTMYGSRGRQPFHTFFPAIVDHPDEKLYRRLWWAWSLVGLYLVPSLLYTKFVLKMKLRDLGLSTDGLLRHAPLYLGIFAVILPFAWLASGTDGFQTMYPFVPYAGRDWTTLIVWELSYAAQFFALELLFRGVLVFGPARVLGPWGIVVMTLPYMAIHFRKPFAECLGSIFAGSGLGVIAMRTRSVYLGMVIHIGVAWSMDAMVLWRRGDLPRLLGLD